MSSYPDLTDMFCGCGGSSQGAQSAGAEVKLAMNHWDLAIESHNENFPETVHVCADVREMDPRRYRSTTLLWASPECTNHSLAKGKKRTTAQLKLLENGELDPAAERSRATMWDVVRFSEYHDYQMVFVENVIDARKWRLFNAWIKAMSDLDYEYHICYFNSMFFGVPQSRDRMYVVFWKKGTKAPNLDYRPVMYCPKCEKDVNAVQSFKKLFRWGAYGDRRQYLYRCPTCAEKTEPYLTPAYTVIDWANPGTRIGDRKRPLKESTLRRIRAGLDKYGDQVLVVKLTRNHAKNLRAQPASRPLTTQTSRQEDALTIPPSAVLVFKANADAISPADPLTTIVAAGTQHALVRLPYMTVNYSPGYDIPITGQMATITATDHHALVQPTPFISCYYRHQSTNHVGHPLPTIVGTLKHALVSPPPMVMSYYSRDSAIKHVGEPVGTITGGPRHALVVPEKPEVDDCYFRMFTPFEIKLGMAFHPDYIVKGNKRDQVKQCGNAVNPPPAEWLFQRGMEVL